jgi:hypothetical protein
MMRNVEQSCAVLVEHAADAVAMASKVARADDPCRTSLGIQDSAMTSAAVSTAAAFGWGGTKGAGIDTDCIDVGSRWAGSRDLIHDLIRVP